MRRSLVVSLVVIVVLAVGSMAGTVAAGNAPELGLDLQGGAYLVLEPKDDAAVREGTLDQAIEIIRQRVDASGVAEPDISRQGRSIIVQLPGVKDQQKVIDRVGKTAELRFRSVIEPLPAEGAEPEPTTTTAPTGPTTTSAPGAPSTTTTVKPGEIPTTKEEDDKPEAIVVLPVKPGKDEEPSRLRLGPTELTGKVIKTARAAFDTQGGGGWTVDFETTGPGRKQWADLTTKLNQQPLAIVLDGVVQSAPVIQQPLTDGKGVISGSFTEGEAKDLALVLRYGALPVELEPQTIQTVSATLGRDSLRAGIVAGLIGLALVLLYMIIYYRALGLVVVLGLSVSGMLLWSIVSLLGETSGLALTLAGATGIIVSVGVTVDSYVVFFERLKDEIRSGKTIRSSVDRGFSRAYRTILAADISSLIGAGLLYVLTVGSVRGFAFFLGLSTLLDLVVSYFFSRPIVGLLARSRVFTEAPWLGVARGLAVEPSGSPT